MTIKPGFNVMDRARSVSYDGTWKLFRISQMVLFNTLSLLSTQKTRSLQWIILFTLWLLCSSRMFWFFKIVRSLIQLSFWYFGRMLVNTSLITFEVSVNVYIADVSSMFIHLLEICQHLLWGGTIETVKHTHLRSYPIGARVIAYFVLNTTF